MLAETYDIDRCIACAARENADGPHSLWAPIRQGVLGTIYQYRIKSKPWDMPLVFVKEK